MDFPTLMSWRAIRWLLFVLVAAVAATGCLGGGVQRHDLVVEVTDTAGDPVRGAMVTVGTQTATTNAQGAAEFRQASGTVTVKAEKPGYRAAEEQLNLAGQTTIPLVLQDVEGIPLSVRAQLNSVLEDWNEHFEDAPFAPVHWEYQGTIETMAELQNIRDALVDPDLVRAAVGDPQKPEELALELLVGAEPGMISAWEAAVDDLLSLGLHWYEFEWILSDTGVTYVSVVISDGTDALWGSVIATLVVIEELDADTSVFSQQTVRSGGRNINWLWGSRRGEIRWELSCGPAPNLNCEFEVSAWMNMGDAQVEAQLVERDDDCCELRYGWAWRTPTGSITMQWNSQSLQFDVTVTGLGSSGQGIGQVVCCP